MLVSGITTTTPFTTPTAQCSGTDPRGETWSVDGARFAAQGYRVYTAPVNYGAGPVKPDPPTFSNCPPRLPASMTINSRGDIYANAGALASFIAYLHTQYGVRTIRIVAHSYGGLWTRGAMRLASAAFPGVTMQSITTLGTPHLGSFMADIAEGVDPGFCGQDTTCKVIAYLVIAAKDATFEPALSQVTAVSMAQWNPGQGASLNGIPVSAIAGDAVSLPGITNPYVSPNDVLVGLRSAQAAGLKGPGVIPQLSCFAPFPDVHSTTFLPLFPHVRYALTNDPVIATDVEQTLAGTPAPTPCPSSAGREHLHARRHGDVADGVLGPRNAACAPRPRRRRDRRAHRHDGHLSRSGAPLDPAPLLHAATDHSAAELRWTHPHPARLRGCAVRPRYGRLGHPAPKQRAATSSDFMGRRPARRSASRSSMGSGSWRPRWIADRSFAATGALRTITCRVTVTPRHGRAELAVITLHL